jgi:hypothetical protein
MEVVVLLVLVVEEVEVLLEEVEVLLEEVEVPVEEVKVPVVARAAAADPEGMVKEVVDQTEVLVVDPVEVLVVDPVEVVDLRLEGLGVAVDPVDYPVALVVLPMVPVDRVVLSMQ